MIPYLPGAALDMIRRREMSDIGERSK